MGKKQQICYSFKTAYFLRFLIHLKWRSFSFRPHQVFPIFMVQMLVFPNSTGPRPWLQKGRNIPGLISRSDCHWIFPWHIWNFFIHVWWILFFTSQSSIFQLCRDRSSWGDTSTNQGFMCLTQGHNAVTPVRLKPATPWSQVKHSTTEPLPSPHTFLNMTVHVKILFIGTCEVSFHAAIFCALQLNINAVLLSKPVSKERKV